MHILENLVVPSDFSFWPFLPFCLSAIQCFPSQSGEFQRWKKITCKIVDLFPCDVFFLFNGLLFSTMFICNLEHQVNIFFTKKNLRKKKQPFLTLINSSTPWPFNWLDPMRYVPVILVGASQCCWFRSRFSGSELNDKSLDVVHEVVSKFDRSYQAHSFQVFIYISV